MAELEYYIVAKQHNCNQNYTQLKTGQWQAFDNIVEAIKSDPATAYSFINNSAETSKILL